MLIEEFHNFSIIHQVNIHTVMKDLNTVCNFLMYIIYTIVSWQYTEIYWLFLKI